MSNRATRGSGESGMVTVETALSTGALAAVTLCLVWVITVVGMQMRCVDAARDGARAAARGESTATSRTEALHSAPDGANVDISTRGHRVEVEVSANARPDWEVLSGLPTLVVRGHAVVAVEPGVGAQER